MYKEMKKTDAGVYNFGNPTKVGIKDSASIASGQVFLKSELEKREEDIKKPLTSVTYPRDVIVRVGGGWAENISAMYVNYGASGSTDNADIVASNTDGIPTVTADFSKKIFKTHPFARALRVGWLDVQRGNFAGRSIDEALRDGVRLTYDKHMDKNVYEGFEEYGTYGLVNDPNISATTASATGTGGATTFASKTADQILDDFNKALIDAWKRAEYDEDAMPNHVIMPYEQFNMLVTRKVSNDASKSILTYIQENNIVTKSGGDLFIAGNRWCDSAGVGATDRMVVYANKERYLNVDELQPLSLVMTEQNSKFWSYDSTYAANISELKKYYDGVTMLYVDGI